MRRTLGTRINHSMLTQGQVYRCKVAALGEVLARLVDKKKLEFEIVELPTGGRAVSERKLVRARPKLPEQMPEWGRCCAEAIAHNQTLGEMTIDLARIDRNRGSRCRFCKTPLPPSTGVMDIADGLFVGLELLDLDEGSFDHGR